MGCTLRLQRFCCCCTLKTGTLIIATVGWIFTLLQIFGTPVYISASGDHESKEIQEFAKKILIVRICGCVLSLTINVLLLVGVFKKSKYFLLPWLIIWSLSCGIVTIWVLILFVLLFSIPSPILGYFILIFILVILFCLFNWYCWLCVWSHYMELSDEESGATPNVQFSAPPAYSKESVPIA